MSEVTGLRLLAMDGDDLKVISAACQDGVCKPADLVFEASRRRFRIEINRYCWEKATENQHGFRVRSVLSFEDVSKVRARGLPPRSADLVLSLLSVEWIEDETNPPGGEVRLMFAGDGEMVISADCLDATLIDTTKAWPTKNRPEHKA